jgi:predicted AAA+ superfamily ATPase
MIPRRQSSHIEKLLSYFPAVAIVGPRQVGKTTLVLALSKILEKEVIYLDLEYPEDLSKLQDPVLFLEQKHDACVIIDEVQRMRGLFPVLRSLIDRDRQPARFILLGSASPELIRDSSESLAGRIAYVELSPFNFLEIQDRFEYRKHWFYGGFPNALLAPDASMSVSWISQFVRTYMERDLPALGFGGNSAFAMRFWQMLAHHNGNLLNASSLANALGVSVTTIKRYLDFFEQAYLIRLLQPWEYHAKKRLVKSPKIYLRDTGILHYLAGIGNMDTLYGHTLVGSSWENYVIEQIGQLLPDNFTMHFYRTQAGAEVDLVLVDGLIPRFCIEIKHSSTPAITRGMIQVIDDLQTPHNFIITPQTATFDIKSGVTVCNFKDFLTNQLFRIINNN